MSRAWQEDRTLRLRSDIAPGFPKNGTIISKFFLRVGTLAAQTRRVIEFPEELPRIAVGLKESHLRVLQFGFPAWAIEINGVSTLCACQTDKCQCYCQLYLN